MPSVAVKSSLMTGARAGIFMHSYRRRRIAFGVILFLALIL